MKPAATTELSTQTLAGKFSHLVCVSTGATTKELMHRLGHASPAAELVYQHAVSERDSEIARALGVMVTGDVAIAPEHLAARRAQRA